MGRKLNIPRKEQKYEERVKKEQSKKWIAVETRSWKGEQSNAY